MLNVRSNEYAANARKLNSLGNPAGNSEAGNDKSLGCCKRALGGKGSDAVPFRLEDETGGSALCCNFRVELLVRRTARGSLPCGNMGGPQSLPYTASCASFTLFIVTFHCYVSLVTNEQYGSSWHSCLLALFLYFSLYIFFLSFLVNNYSCVFG